MSSSLSLFFPPTSFLLFLTNPESGVVIPILQISRLNHRFRSIVKVTQLGRDYTGIFNWSPNWFLRLSSYMFCWASWRQGIALVPTGLSSLHQRLEGLPEGRQLSIHCALTSVLLSIVSIHVPHTGPGSSWGYTPLGVVFCGIEGGPSWPRESFWVSQAVAGPHSSWRAGRHQSAVRPGPADCYQGLPFLPTSQNIGNRQTFQIWQSSGRWPLPLMGVIHCCSRVCGEHSSPWLFPPSQVIFWWRPLPACSQTPGGRCSLAVCQSLKTGQGKRHAEQGLPTFGSWGGCLSTAHVGNPGMLCSSKKPLSSSKNSAFFMCPWLEEFCVSKSWGGWSL